MGDRRRKTGDRRLETEDRRWDTEETQKTGTGDEILETGRDTVDRTVVLETENRRWDS